MNNWKWVFAFDFGTAVAYLAIALFIIRGLVSTRQLLRNHLAVATATIFMASGAYHVLHALDLIFEDDAMNRSIARTIVGHPVDVLVTAATALTGAAYLFLRRFYGELLASPAMFNHAAETRYRQLAANLPHTAVFVFDKDLRYVLVGGAGMKDVGYQRSSMEGKLICDVVPRPVWKRISPYYQAAVAGAFADFDHTSSVTGVTFHNRIGPLLDESGRIIGGLVISDDVTADRAMHEQLAQAQAFGAAVLAASPDITVIIEVETGQMSWSSRSVMEVLGWPPGETPAEEARSLTNLVVDDDRESIGRISAAVAQLPDGESITSRFRIRSVDGYRWLTGQSTPFRRGPDGQVWSYLSVVRDITDVVEMERRMEHAALHDSLTALPNRTLLLDRLTSALARADRLSTKLAVLFCDLDGFKKVNDTYGHAAGDAVLVEVARRLDSLVRKSDSIARVGGDEFVIILEPAAAKLAPPAPRTAGDATVATHNSHLEAVATMVAERVRTEISRPFDVDGHRYGISISVGMTFAERGSQAAEVLRKADVALYRAKRRGRNRVEVFDESFRVDAVQR